MWEKKSFFAMTKVLPLLNTFVSLITAQDGKTVVFPINGNETAFEVRSKIESVRPDIIRPTESFLRPTSLAAASHHFLPAPQRTFLHHRSESLPYVYEYPNYGYPMAHAIDHSIGPSSKHLVIVSFIGLLLLFAIIQNTITAVKRREALIEVLSSRQKRDLFSNDFHSVSPEQEDILNDDARVRCIQRTVCLENRRLFKVLGKAGKILAKYLTRSVEKSLRQSPGWDRLVDDAGAAGIRGEDCYVLYRDCDESVSTKNHRRVLAKARDAIKNQI